MDGGGGGGGGDTRAWVVLRTAGLAALGAAYVRVLVTERLAAGAR